MLLSSFKQFECMRAQKRMDGEVVFGNPITVGYPQKINGERSDSFQNDREHQHFSVGSASVEMAVTPPTYVPQSWLFPMNPGNGVSNFPSEDQEFFQDLPISPWEQSWSWGNKQINQPKEIHHETRRTISVSDAGSDAEYCYQSCVTRKKVSEKPGWSNRATTPSQQRPFSNNSSKSKEGLKSDRSESFAKRPKAISPVPIKPGRKSLDSSWSIPKATSNIRKCRTPSPYMLNSKPTVTPSKVNGVWKKGLNDGSDSERFFNPISASNGNVKAIELHVTNLDQSIEPMELKKILMSLFRDHVMVLHISVFVLSDGNFAASVKVPTLQDAQYAISQLHRKKVGFKRIMISYAHTSHPQNPQFIRWQVVTLLQDVPGRKLPLFKFLEMFESRYVTTVSVSDLYRLRDVCIISDESTGRMVSLNPDHRNTPSPSVVTPQDVEPFCSKHYKICLSTNKGWAEQGAPALPNVHVPLMEFRLNVLRLLESHSDILPLASFCDCYEAECGLLNVSETGVPLEHLVTCISKVELAVTNGVKHLRSTSKSTHSEEAYEDASKSISPSLASQLSLFGRELVDLMKTQPHCQLMFNRFIPAYHHHFGRQCRVADYGFTKLIDLLEALPAVVQVMGEGNKRIVTLSHRSQVRRFTSDLIRVLKSQPKKKMKLSELPLMFERILLRSFDPVDYGLCEVSDLVHQLSENVIVVSEAEGDIYLAIPKKEQTADEIERTKQFSKEVVELLCHAPHNSILFNKFIPAYHHHYGHQCRVADFGFSKLIELFEAIPDVVQLDEDHEGERRVSLTYEKKITVLSEQICELVTPSYPPGLLLSSLPTTFLWHYGYALKPEVYQSESLDELLSKISTIQIVETDTGRRVTPVESALLRQLSQQVRRLLILSENGKMTLHEIQNSFSSFLQHHLTPSVLSHLLPDTIKLINTKDEVIFELTPLYLVAKNVVALLLKHDGRLSLSALETHYYNEYEANLRPSAYGFNNLSALLSAIPQVVLVRGKGLKRHVILHKDFEASIKNKTNEPTAVRLLKSNEQSSVLDENGFHINGSAEASDWHTTWNFQNDCPMVTLPEMTTPPIDMEETSSLISPCKGLLAPSARPLNDFVVPPKPSELPLPEMHLFPKSEKGQALMKKEWHDLCSGIVNGFPMRSPTCSPQKEETPTTASKRKMRLAAQFPTPIDLN